MAVTVLFFGVLSEVTGIDLRHYENVKSTNDLRHKILDDYPEIENYNYRFSVNNEIINDERALRDMDEVALLPPFAGG